MPKIIEHLKDDILATAGDMIENEGIGGFSIRTLSQRLGIAPATVYNYFESKDRIVGEIIMGRWSNFISDLDNKIMQGGDTLSLLETISEGLKHFMRPIFATWLVNDDSGLTKESLEHIRKMRSVVFEMLCSRVEIILGNNGMASDTARKNAPIITRLLIICSHDHTFELAATVTAINEIKDL